MNDAAGQSRATQLLAADPRRCIALAAAAGSGKTTVLVERYVRLCLDGADPRSIVAVTFTRKATVEIKERLLRTALDLARAEADTLAKICADLRGESGGPLVLSRASWLLEALFEDPAGLAVGTIHAFCQQVIGRFAAAAGLDPRYGILEREADLQDEALDRLEEELARDPSAARDFAALAGSPADGRRRLLALFGQRVHLQRWLDRVTPPPAGPVAALTRRQAACLDPLVADLRMALGADDRETRARELAEALRAFVDRGLAAIEATEAGRPTDGFRRWRTETAAQLQSAADQLTADPFAWPVATDAVRQALLTGGDLRKPHGRKDSKEARHDAYAAAAAPVVAALQRGVAVDVVEDNARLLRHGLRAIDLYGDLKRRDRALDFQDLEYLALRLLTDDATLAQVHQRLDARLDHLLLDEFQDTNRNQWDLLAPLLEELLAGGDPPRTGFVVGDVKQAIYGFRGADATIFAESAQLVGRAGGQLLELPTNFRSLPAVVASVGTLFQHEPLRSLLGDDVAPGAVQLAAREDGRGEVLLVEPFQAEDTAAAHAAAAAAVVRLVRKLAADGCGLGSILLLCRRKTHVALYEMALRRAGIPIVPAGRGLLARSREVQDLLALLRWLTFPADDIAGAAVLRSPLARLPESTVQGLLAARLAAPGRRRHTLWEVVQDTTDLGALAARLREWQLHAGLDPLHDLLRRIYRTGDVLARMEIAFGEQARFNLLRLLDVALAVDAAAGSARDLADELDRAAVVGGEEEGALPHDEGGRVRVMTVHAAKGLEAPVVIMVDAAGDVQSDADRLALGPQGPLVFGRLGELVSGPARHDGTALPAPLAAAGAAAAARQITEEAHILYVAMTRARDRLFVLGAHGRAAPRQSYHVWLAAAAAAAEAATATDLPWRRLTAAEFLGELTAGEADASPANATVNVTAAARARLCLWTPPSLAPRLRTVNPSRLAEGDRALDLLASDADRSETPAGGETPATHRGTRIHLWLERAARAGAMPAGAGPEWAEAAAVFANPAFAWIFHPERDGGRGLCEQPIIHRCGREGRTEVRMVGTIDRLVLRPGRADIVDFKSNRVVAAEVSALVAHYRAQIAAYHEALTALWPGRRIGGWLLFTHVGAPAGQGLLVEVAPCP